MKNTFSRVIIATVIVVSTVLILGVGTVNWSSIHYRDKKSNLRSEYDMSRNVISAAHSIWKYSGVEIKSLSQLERSAYYPFSQSYRKSCAGHTMYFNHRRSDRKIKLIVGFTIKGFNAKEESVLENWIEDTIIVKEDAAIVTKRMLISYTSGVKLRESNIESIRNEFLDYQKSIDSYSKKRGGCTSAFLLNPVMKSPLVNDMPKNEVELQIYLDWLALSEGINELRDAWNRKIFFSISNGKMIAISSGNDGIKGTFDDIVVQKKL